MIRNTIILLLVTFSGLKLNAQTTIIYPYNTPKSPNSATLARYLEIPTDLHTGQINYSIPLETVQFGEVNVPIILEYQNSGLKVAELPSWVGLGWNLMAGGAITRTVKGLPDDCAVGLLNSSTMLNQAYLNQLSGTQRYLYFKDIVDGFTDSQFDIFNFEFCGQKGSFYIDRQGACQQIPKGNNKITYTRDVNGLISSFEVADVSGTKYLYSIREDAITDADNNIYANTFYDAINGTTWYISKITSATNRVVNFEYNQYQISYRNYSAYHEIPRTGESDPKCATGSTGAQSPGMTIYTPAFQLKKISWDLGKIDFVPGANRMDMQDLSSQNVLPSLSKIIVKNELDIPIKEFEFNTVQQPRLLLRNLLFNNSSTGQPVSKYEFNYYQEAAIPTCNRNSNYFNAQDYWGYFNGSPQSTMLPYNILRYGMININGLNILEGQSANRNVNSAMSQVGMLKDVIYPTGGGN